MMGISECGALTGRVKRGTWRERKKTITNYESRMTGGRGGGNTVWKAIKN